MPRRRAGVLLPLEEAILRHGIEQVASGAGHFHGFALAEALGDGGLDGKLLGHGTLYKALARLEREGLIESHWEEIDAATEGRPRRRLYKVTGSAAEAIATSHAVTAAPAGRLAPS